MERIFNIVHYCLYVLDYKLHLLSNKINPFLLIYKIPYIKKRDKKLDRSSYKVYNDTFGNTGYGLSITVSGIILSSTVFLLLLSLCQLTIKICHLSFTLNNYFYASLCLITYLICFFLVFRNDKYLKYFKEFKNWDKTERRKKIILTILFVISVIFLFFYSLLI